MVTTKTQVKVFTDVAVDPAAYNEPLAMVTGVFHVHHLMVILMALRLGTTWLKTHTFTFRYCSDALSEITQSGLTDTPV